MYISALVGTVLILLVSLEVQLSSGRWHGQEEDIIWAQDEPFVGESEAKSVLKSISPNAETLDMGKRDLDGWEELIMTHLNKANRKKQSGMLKRTQATSEPLSKQMTNIISSACPKQKFCSSLFRRLATGYPIRQKVAKPVAHGLASSGHLSRLRLLKLTEDMLHKH